MRTSSVYCFPDTNAFIHFQTFDEVDWPTKLGAAQIYLVLAPSVMRELNKYKDDNTNERRRRRVRAILSKLEKLLDETDPGTPSKVRAGVDVFDIVDEPAVDWSARKLDPQVEDDRILATIIEFMAVHPSESVVLLSNDFPARRKAKRRKIQALDPEGLIERFELSSAEDKKIKDLEQRLRAAESRLPKLDLSFHEQSTSCRRVIRAVGSSNGTWTTDEAIAQELAQKQQQLDHVIAQAPARVSQDEIEDYRRQYQDYLAFVEDVLVRQRIKATGRRCELRFLLENIGSAPASGVDIQISFPAGAFVVAVDDENDDYWGLGDLRFPREPTPRWRESPWGGSGINILSSAVISAPNRPVIPKPKGPLYSRGERSAVHYEHPKLRHREEWNMRAVAVYLPPTVEGGFEIRYSIHADELLEPVEGRLAVVLQWETIDNR